MSSLTKYQTKKYNKMADSIIKLFDQVGEEDSKGWKMLNMQLPQNPISKKVYTRFNQIYLYAVMLENNFSTPYFATFNQINSMGGIVNGKGFPITFTSIIYKYKGKTQSKEQMLKHFSRQNEFKSFWKFMNQSKDCKYYKTLKFFTVHHLSETTLADQFSIDQYTPITHELDNIDQKVTNLLENLKIEQNLKLEIKPSNSAFYNLLNDSITIPEIGQYEEKAVYYSVLFHELTHWTGAESRLNRDMSGSMKTKTYAFEELVAELSSFFLCANFGIDKGIERGTALYLKGWFSALKSDISVFTDVVNKASKASEFILDYYQEEKEIQEAA